MQLKIDAKQLFELLQDHVEHLAEIIVEFFDACQHCKIVFENITFTREDINDPLYIANQKEIEERLRLEREDGHTDDGSENWIDQEWFVQIWPSDDCYSCGSTFCSEKCLKTHYVTDPCLCSDSNQRIRRKCPKMKCSICNVIECGRCGMTCSTCKKSGHKTCLSAKSCREFDERRYSSDCWHCGDADCYAKWICHNLTFFLSKLQNAVSKTEPFLESCNLEKLPQSTKHEIQQTIEAFKKGAKHLQNLRVPTLPGPFHHTM